VALPFTLKKYLKKAKEELRKLKYFTMQKYNVQKNPLIKTNILPDIMTLELISSFNTSQNISSFKNPHMKNRPIIIYYLVGANIP
jgi:hypothetical protein